MVAMLHPITLKYKRFILNKQDIDVIQFGCKIIEEQINFCVVMGSLGVPDLNENIANTFYERKHNLLWCEHMEDGNMRYVPGTGIGIDYTLPISYMRATPQRNLLLGRVLWSNAVIVVNDFFKSNSQIFEKIPQLEFLRHIRNGFAHGNKFHFVLRKNEIFRKAEFDNLEITLHMQGMAVFDNEGEDGFIKIGDILALLLWLKEFLKSVDLKNNYIKP